MHHGTSVKRSEEITTESGGRFPPGEKGRPAGSLGAGVRGLVNECSSGVCFGIVLCHPRFPVSIHVCAAYCAMESQWRKCNPDGPLQQTCRYLCSCLTYLPKPGLQLQLAGHAPAGYSSLLSRPPRTGVALTAALQAPGPHVTLVPLRDPPLPLSAPLISMAPPSPLQLRPLEPPLCSPPFPSLFLTLSLDLI